MMNIINDRDGIGARKNDQVLMIKPRLGILLRQVFLNKLCHIYMLRNRIRQL